MKTQLLFFLLIRSIIRISAQTPQDQWVACNKAGCQLLDPYYSEGITFTWDGECKNGKANGIGKATKLKNGVVESIYEGEYKDGIREGEGKFTWSDGTIRVGTFINGQLTGKGSYVGGKTANKYQGDFINYFFHGNGVLTNPNGSKFEGFFVSDNMYTGKFTDYNGKITFLQGGHPVDKIKEDKIDYHPKLNEPVTEYFDDKWKRCEAKKAAFFRVVTYKAENMPNGKVKDFFITGECM